MWTPNKTEKGLIRRAVVFFGEEGQMLKAVEEYAEASAEIARLAFSLTQSGEASRYDFDKLAAELADTQIMQAQLCSMIGQLDQKIDEQRSIKLERLAALTEFTPTL